MEQHPSHLDMVKALAALGHDARLMIFRVLLRSGPDGLIVGDLGAQTGLAPSTLAHHLSTLVQAGLVTQERRGRAVYNRADRVPMRRLAQFLDDECCRDVTAAPAASPAPAKTHAA